MSNGHGEERAGHTGRLPEDVAIRLSEEITGLIAAGLPLASGLRATAEEMPRSERGYRNALFSVANALEAGAPVNEALKTAGAHLPEHLRGLISISSQNGRTTQALGRYVGFSSLGSNLRWQLWASLANPAVAMFLACLLFIVICVTLVSNFENIYKDFGVNLPRITVGLMIIARPFYQSWEVLLEGFLGLLVIGMIFFFVVDRRTRRGIAGSIPVLGPVFRNISFAEFFHLLALLIESEVPLPEAIRLAARAVKDSAIERGAIGVSSDVAQGTSLSKSVSQWHVFPRGLSRVIEWAEGTSSLPESLRMLGEMFASRARSQAEFAGRFLVVLSFMWIFFGTAVFVVGLMLPMISLISALSG